MQVPGGPGAQDHEKIRTREAIENLPCAGCRYQGDLERLFEERPEFVKVGRRRGGEEEGGGGTGQGEKGGGLEAAREFGGGRRGGRRCVCVCGSRGTGSTR